MPDTVRMRPVEGEPFYFETDFEGSRHAHYGRFLRLVSGQTVELTWITFEGGTEGTETIVAVELIPRGPQETNVRLTHAGFVADQHRDRHRDAWPLVLEQMQQRLAE